ncbi:MAG: hypothetical protein methR_P2078 [Methyloprofundus sp.]|nr:MAG: hypothetical protein methR_P2078 [Methyloprofundus sp.]
MNIKPIFYSVVMTITACAISLEKGAEIVQLIYQRPSADTCQFIGQTSASDGGMVSGDFMTDAKIHEGAANQMKNKAFAMGGNLVFIQHQFNENKLLTATKTKQTMIGFVYYCFGLPQVNH